MILRFSPALPCDVPTKSGALCGRATNSALLRAAGDGWRITPVCPACAARIAAYGQAPRKEAA
jgi:hypothetical protein